jgi:hypothetical protein
MAHLEAGFFVLIDKKAKLPRVNDAVVRQAMGGAVGRLERQQCFSLLLHQRLQPHGEVVQKRAHTVRTASHAHFGDVRRVVRVPEQRRYLRPPLGKPHQQRRIGILAPAAMPTARQRARRRWRVADGEWPPHRPSKAVCSWRRTLSLTMWRMAGT